MNENVELKEKDLESDMLIGHTLTKNFFFGWGTWIGGEKTKKPIPSTFTLFSFYLFKESQLRCMKAWLWGDENEKKNNFILFMFLKERKKKMVDEGRIWNKIR